MKSRWSKCLDCTHEKENPSDYFTIKTCQKDAKIVGNLPMGISQPIKYLLDPGTRITVTLTSIFYYASLHIQGNLETPCLIKVYMPHTVKNYQIILMYEEKWLTLIPREGWLTCSRKYFELQWNYRASRLGVKKRKKTPHNQTALLKLKTAKPREDKIGNTMNLGKDIRTFFKPTYCQ